MVQWWALGVVTPARKDGPYDWIRTMQRGEWEMARRDSATAEFGKHAEGKCRVLVQLGSVWATEDRVRNFGAFARSEKLKLLDHAKRLVGQYAVVEIVPVGPKEPLPVIEPGTERLKEPAAIGDGFSTIKVFTCALDEGFGRLFTVPRFWKALLVIQMWAGTRLVEMKVYGIGANWFRTLEKQGVPNGVPDDRQRVILKSYFEQRAEAIARRSTRMLWSIATFLMTQSF